jgi:hypothetical protein
MSRGDIFFPPGEAAGVSRPPEVASLVSPTGQVVRTFGPFPGAEVFVANGRRAPVPLGARTLFAAGGASVYVADTKRYEVMRYGSDGHLEEIIRRTHDPIPVGRADMDAEIEALLRPLPPNRRLRASAEAVLRSLEMPEALPAITALLPDGQGGLWVRNGEPTGSERVTWSVFDAEGRWTRDVRVSTSLHLRSIGTGEALAVAQDAPDVETVHLLDLPAPGR